MPCGSKSALGQISETTLRSRKQRPGTERVTFSVTLLLSQPDPGWPNDPSTVWHIGSWSIVRRAPSGRAVQVNPTQGERLGQHRSLGARRRDDPAAGINVLVAMRLGPSLPGEHRGRTHNGVDCPAPSQLRRRRGVWACGSDGFARRCRVVGWCGSCFTLALFRGLHGGFGVGLRHQGLEEHLQ